MSVLGTLVVGEGRGELFNSVKGDHMLHLHRPKGMEGNLRTSAAVIDVVKLAKVLGATKVVFDGTDLRLIAGLPVEEFDYHLMMEDRRRKGPDWDFDPTMV